MADAKKRLWGWDISAVFYKWSYVRIAHQIDEDLLAWLGPRIEGATVADCGCGPGVVTEKLLAHGAGHVFAIDSNRGMLNQVTARLGDDNERVTVVEASHEGDTLPSLQREHLNGSGYDVVLFKRSLYMPPARAEVMLETAASVLRPGGSVTVVHPERSVLRYCFAPPVGFAWHTPYHLFNRTISKFVEAIGGEEYTVYTQKELLDLAQRAAPDAVVEAIPSQQRAYNLVSITRPT